MTNNADSGPLRSDFPAGNKCVPERVKLPFASGTDQNKLNVAIVPGAYVTDVLMTNSRKADNAIDGDPVTFVSGVDSGDILTAWRFDNDHTSTFPLRYGKNNDLNHYHIDTIRYCPAPGADATAMNSGKFYGLLPCSVSIGVGLQQDVKQIRAK